MAQLFRSFCADGHVARAARRISGAGNISLLKMMEIRRRTWGCLSSYERGASITSGRPGIWPFRGVDAALHLNTHDKDLTDACEWSPPLLGSDQVTPYTAATTQVHFHMVAHDESYEKAHFQAISECGGDATFGVCLASRLEKRRYRQKLVEEIDVPGRYALPQTIMSWAALEPAHHHAQATRGPPAAKRRARRCGSEQPGVWQMPDEVRCRLLT